MKYKSDSIRRDNNEMDVCNPSGLDNACIWAGDSKLKSGELTPS